MGECRDIHTAQTRENFSYKQFSHTEVITSEVNKFTITETIQMD